MRVLAYRIQAAAFGDLDRTILRRLRDEALEMIPSAEAIGQGDCEASKTTGARTFELCSEHPRYVVELSRPSAGSIALKK